QACSRLSAPSTSKSLPSTWIVAMVQVSSYPFERAWLMESRLHCGLGRDANASCRRELRRRRGRGTDHASLELRTEILDRTAQRFDGARCVGAEGLAGAKEVDQAEQGL